MDCKKIRLLTLRQITALKLLCCLLMASVFSIQLQAQLYIVEPQHRLPEELAIVLNEQFYQNAKISAYANQLIINASPNIMQQINALIDRIDLPVQTLLLTLRLKDQRQQNISSVETQAKYCKDNVCISNSPASLAGANIQLTTTNKRKTTQGEQQVRAISGRPAYISMGQSVPLAQNTYVAQGVHGARIIKTREYRDLDQGFYALPKVIGDRVTLDIRVTNDHLDTQGAHAKVDTQRLVTTLDGRLGEWMDLGDQRQKRTIENTGLLSSQRGVLERLSRYEIKASAINNELKPIKPR